MWGKYVLDIKVTKSGCFSSVKWMSAMSAAQAARAKRQRWASMVEFASSHHYHGSRSHIYCSTRATTLTTTTTITIPPVHLAIHCQFDLECSVRGKRAAEVERESSSTSQCLEMVYGTRKSSVNESDPILTADQRVFCESLRWQKFTAGHALCRHWLLRCLDCRAVMHFFCLFRGSYNSL